MEKEYYIATKIKKRIFERGVGQIYFISDFDDLENDIVVRQTLNRLEKQKTLIRLSRGLYFYPEVNRFGIYYPSLHTIAQKIAKRDKATIIPTGIMALHLLGLSTQVPTKAVYYTTGSKRKIKVGDQEIQFIWKTPKYFSFKNEIIALVVSALKEIGQNNVDKDITTKIEHHVLQVTDTSILEHDIRLAPRWIQHLLLPIKQKHKA